MGHDDHFERLKTALAGRYRLERELGAGGMATVYLAEDLKHHRKVAIKVLKPELAAVLGSDRFLREIEIAARLTHPHILPLHDSGEAEGFLYYVMPYIEGESLRERLAREKQLPLPEAARILKELVDALAYAHSQGVVHRDIKPDNVMLAGRHALVTDFGVAKALSDATGQHQLTSFGVALGTPRYMAPEQAAADPIIDHRADIYAAGVVAYELLTGRPPFLGNTTQEVLVAHINEEPEPVTRHREGIPAALAGAVMRCLAKNRNDRWQSAGDLLAELEALITPTGGVTPVGSWPVERLAAKRRLQAAVGAGALAMLLGGAWVAGVFGSGRDEEWVRTEAIPEIQRLADAEDFMAAHLLAREADAATPRDSLLYAAWQRFARRVTITSDPAGARVSWREYETSDTTWHYLGTTPLDSVWYPRGFYRLRLELQGFRQLHVAPDFGLLVAGQRFPLDPVDATPEGVVRVPGGVVRVQSPGLESLEPIELGDYLMDRFEVTNRRYKAFVDAGGYGKREYWRHPFVKDGVRLTWEQAIPQFTDQTGRSGPSTWELGGYPKGQDDYPVTGLSWYEAAAYAAFEGRDLPTIYHWNWAAGAPATSWIVPASNFADNGPAQVGQYDGMNRFGTHDMAGNAREWCFNEALGGYGGRYILGGGWNDAAYMFVDPYTQSPWDRSTTNGFRLITYLEADENLERAKRPITRPFRDFLAERPVSDAEFRVYLRMFAYDRAPLNAVVERADTAEDWIRQKVTFDAAYGNERVIAYLHLPRKGTPPYQTVVYFPGSNVIFTNSMDQDFSVAWDFIVKGGRALMYPVYRGTLERRTELNTDQPSETVVYRDYVIQWARDLGRSVDYLETREDIDAGHLGYFGFSWGGRMGGLMLAVEPRLRAAVLHVAGLKFQRALPEADPFNFVPRIKIPVLMVNGRYDQFFPLETSQIPMFRLLGTPPEHKRHVVYEAGHFVPRPQLIRETLDWYDRYLVPVK